MLELDNNENPSFTTDSDKPHSTTGLFLRRRVRNLLHKYESYFLGATQVGSRGLCASIEAYWFTHGIHPTHAADVPVKFLTYGVWGATKYFQWMGVFHLYHAFVPESQTAAAYFAAKDKIRRLKDNPAKEGFDTAKTLLRVGVNLGKDAIHMMNSGYELGDNQYYYAGVNPGFVIRKLED